MEEMDIKWNMALLSMRADKFWKRTGKKISIQGSDVAGFDKSKVKCFNCHKMGHFARECRAPKSQERGRRKSYRQGSKAEEKSSKALMAIDGIGWDWSYMENEEDHALVADGETPTEFALMANIENKVFDNSLCSKDYQLEGRLVEYREREVKYIEKIRTLEMYRASNLESIKILNNEVETLKEEKDVVDGKKNTESLNNKIDELKTDKEDLKNDLYEANVYRHSYKLGIDQLEVRIAEYKAMEVKYIETIRSLERDKECNLGKINKLISDVETLQDENDLAYGKLARLLKSSKDLEDIIESQRSEKVKEGVGYNAVPPPAADLYLMRADKFWKRTGKKINIHGTDVAGFDKSKVECFNCHKMGHFARECRAPRSQERGRKESYRQGTKAEEKTPKALMAIDGVGWDWSYMVNEGKDHALITDEEAPTEFALMANTKSKVFDNSLCSNEYKELEGLKLKKDGLDGKLAGLLKASKNLNHLIESQRSDQVKEEVGYNAVPPPAADLYLSPKKDLSWTGLPEFLDDTVTDYSRPSPTVASISAEGQNKDNSTSKNVASPNPPKPFVKFVKPKDNQPESPEFVLHKKPCFNCGDFSHLANDCRRRVQRETTRSQNHIYRSPSHRSVGHRTHGAPMRPPLRSVGHRPHGTSMRPSNRPTSHRPYGPSINPIRPNMNDARPNRSFFIQASSYETRPFYKSSAVKTPYRALWVPTVNRNTPN
nr:hypothetical protein [Tanacetum cinerariifolium]